MWMRASLTMMAVLMLAAPGSLSMRAQDAPKGEAARELDSYEAVFEEFGKRYEVQQTKLDRLAKDENASPQERQAVFDEIRKIDIEYVAALQRYIQRFPNAKDLEPARYEIVITLSRHEDRLSDAVRAADDYLKEHAGSERAKDVQFARAQSLTRTPGREEEALKALDSFIGAWPGAEESDFARTMRVRVLLFMDRTQEAEEALRQMLKLDKVKKSAEAQQFIDRQLDDMDWIGRELPKFTLSTLDNKALSNEDFKGKPMLIFIWDSNSSVCLEELGFVKAAWDKYKDLGLNILGISVNESRPALEQYLKRAPTGFANTWMDRAAEGTLIKRLDVTAIPFNVLVDSQGRVYRYDVRSDELMRYVTRMIERGK